MSNHEFGRKLSRFTLPAAVMLGGVALLQRSKISRLEQTLAGQEQALARQNLIIAARERKNKKLRYEATHDKLTGLLNRAGLEKALSGNRPPVALLYIDGTNQKAVNDILGHDRGDAAIIGTAQVITRSLREQDIAARLGGDEFLVMLNPDPRPEADRQTEWAPEGVMDTVMARMAVETGRYLDTNPDLVEKAGFNIAVGGAIWQDGMSIEDLRVAAEAHMYRVKGQQHESGGQYR